MISALYRYPLSRRKLVAQEWGRRSVLTHARSRCERGVDADTLHRRSLDDARGQLLRHGCTYSAAGEQHWRVIRSVNGRVEQRDVIINGQLWRTRGPRGMPAWLR